MPPHIGCFFLLFSNVLFSRKNRASSQKRKGNFIFDSDGFLCGCFFNVIKSDPHKQFFCDIFSVTHKGPRVQGTTK